MSKRVANPEKLEELNNKIISNTLKESVSIVNYLSTDYVCPCDGYARVVNDSGQDGKIFIYGSQSGSANLFSIGGAVGRFATFVRKGTRLQFSGTATVAVFSGLE